MMIYNDARKASRCRSGECDCMMTRVYAPTNEAEVLRLSLSGMLSSARGASRPSSAPVHRPPHTRINYFGRNPRTFLYFCCLSGLNQLPLKNLCRPNCSYGNEEGQSD